tara:strand:+ start:131 stop:481 length:351 start_codon:yes stop_codon:yes gene_type:complete
VHNQCILRPRLNHDLHAIGATPAQWRRGLGEELSGASDSHWLVCAQVGYPSRAYVWVMARKPEMPRSVLEDIKKRLVTDHQYPEGLPDLVEVPQSWDRDSTAQFGWKRRGVDVSPK